MFVDPFYKDILPFPFLEKILLQKVNKTILIELPSATPDVILLSVLEFTYLLCYQLFQGDFSFSSSSMFIRSVTV